MNLDEAITAAQEKLGGETTSTTAPERGETTSTAPVEAATTPAPQNGATSPASQRTRDEAGRFTTEPKAKTTKAPEKPAAAAPKGDVHGAASVAPPAGEVPAGGAATSPAPPAEAASLPPLKLPSSWKPAAREALAKAPREVQEEAVRIDREVRQVMQEAAPLKQWVAEVDRALAPFEGIARANGMDVMSYAGSVMQTAAQLFQGPPGNRPALIAQLIKAAGVNPEEVNPYLSGDAQPPRQAPPQPTFDPRAEVQRAIQEERAKQTASAFLAKDHEYLEDVMPHFLALVQAETGKGRNLGEKDLHDLLDAARWANPDVRAALLRKQADEKARTQTAATAQAKAAAVSIKSRPAVPAGTKPKGLDGAMAAAREKLGM